MRCCLALCALLACGAPVDETTPTPNAIRVGGSEIVTTALLRALTDTYTGTHTDATFTISTEGSGPGIRNLIAGHLDIAASSRLASPAELEQADVDNVELSTGDARHIVAVDVVTIAVHPSNPTTSLTYDQVIGIFCTRAIDNWSFLGLDDAPIRAVVRDPMSGTRALFEDFFCGPAGLSPKTETATNAEAAKAVSEDPTAISFLSMSADAGKIIGLRPDAGGRPVQPSIQNIVRGMYPLYRDLYLYTRGPAEGQAKAFIDWIATPAGQEVVDQQGFVPLFYRPELLDEPRPLRETIHFEQDKAYPNHHSMARIQMLTEELRARAGEYRHIVLEGYTDDREAVPLVLSRQRAEKVKELLSESLPGLYFEIIPRGPDHPIAPNDTPYGRLRNRRVQIYLAAEEDPELGNEGATDANNAGR